jgi:ribosome-binding factor A
MTTKEIIEKAKKDIKEFMTEYQIRTGERLPIDGVSDLHDYFDANCYVEPIFTKTGEFIYDDETEQEANLVFKELDNFIKNELNK